MAVFRFYVPVQMFVDGDMWENRSTAWLEVDEGPLARALRLLKHGEVSEHTRIPEDAVMQLVRESNARPSAKYPIPDIRGKPAVLVGRGLSSEGYQERFKGYPLFGINPGSNPCHSWQGRTGDVTDGIHAKGSFDAVVTVDALYWKCAAEFVSRYEGPILSMQNNIEHHYGTGTFHGIDSLCWTGPGTSFELAVMVAVGLGATDIVCCGTDFTGNYEEYRWQAVGVAQEARKRGVEVWRDERCPFESLGKVWRGPDSRAR